MHVAGRARGVAALTVVIGLILAGAAPGAASESPEVTCEFQPLAFLHTPLVQVGIARAGGTDDGLSRVTCVSLPQASYPVLLLVTAQARDPVTGDWHDVPSSTRECRGESVEGQAVLACVTSSDYDDPTLSSRRHRGRFELVEPVNLPPQFLGSPVF